MPIQVNYNPAAEAIAQVAFRGGQGQFKQKRDAFALDVARFGEQQRQFDVGTRLNLEELDRRDQLAQFQAAVGLEEQARAMIGRERAQAFDAMVQQQAQAQEIQAKAQQDQLDRLRAIADQQRDMEFTSFLAKQKQVAQAIQNGTLRTPQEVQEVTAQLQAEAQRLGIPGPGAEQFGRPQPDPLEIAGQQAAEINERVFRGENIAFVQPDGKIDFLPYQNTPAGISQEHAAKMEIEQLKQQQAEHKAQSDAQAKQGEAQQKQQQDAEKERQQLEKDRRAAEIKAVEAREKWVMDRMGDLPTPGQEDTLRAQWEQEFGKIYRMAPTPPPAPAPDSQGTKQRLESDAGNPSIQGLPAMLPPGPETLSTVLDAFRQSPEYQSVGNDLERQQIVVQRERQLQQWLVEQQWPFVNSPEAAFQLPAGSWFVGPDFRIHLAPHRNEGGMMNPYPPSNMDSEVAKLRMQMSGMRSAAMGLYDPTSATYRHIMFQTRGLPSYPLPQIAAPAEPAQKPATKKASAKKSAKQPFFSHPLQGARRRVEK